MRVIAVDWSGERRAGGAAKIYRCEAAGGAPSVPQKGGTRDEVARFLIAEAERDPQLVVGLDFAFSVPDWYFEAAGLEDAPSLWRRMAEGEAAALLDHGNCAWPFWGRDGVRSPWRRGARDNEFSPKDPFRAAERATRSVQGIRPKSVFQLAGAGAVGTGSLLGMPLLERLRAAGFAIWPFDDVRLPAAIEIYPRILTGSVVKSDRDACRDYLAREYPHVPEDVRGSASHPEDAFDAFVAARRMWEHVRDLVALPVLASPVLRREGAIWYPGWSDDLHAQLGADRL